MYSERTPTDGKPYYCAICGLGFNEYMACEEPYCTLETIEQARKRMHTEFTLKVEFYAPNKEAVATIVRAMREAGKEISMQAALISHETPTVTLTIENNQIGVKKLQVFNGEDK